MPSYPTIERILARRLPFGMRSVTFLVSLLIVAGGGFAYFNQIEEIVTVPGSLVWSSPKIVISSPELAVVEATDVDVSEPVAAGRVLATLRLLDAEADYRALRVEAVQILARIERLAAERAGRDMAAVPSASYGRAVAAFAAPDVDPADVWGAQYRLFVSRRDLLRRAEAAIRDGIAGLDRQIALGVATTEAHEARIPVFRQIEEMRKTLAESQSGSRLAYLEATDQRMTAELGVTASLRDTAEAETEREREIGRLDSLRQSWLTDIDRDLDEALAARSVIMARLAVAERRAKMNNITAPVDAIVLERADRAPGSVVQRGEHLFTMIPQSGSLKVRLVIPAADIARLKGNEPVRIKFDSLPFQRHGYLAAVIESISTDTVPSNAPDGTSVPVYYANAAIDPGQHLTNLPPGFKLLPGVPLVAEVLVGKRPLYTYFTYPLQQLASRALRESEIGSK